MNSWINTNDSSPQHQEKKHTLLSTIRTYIAALLLMTPSMNVQSEDISKLWQEKFVSSYHENNSSEKKVESMVSYKVIFKDGVRKTLKWLNSISKIPVWGKPIVYYRDEGNIKWKPIRAESVKAMNLPEKFDISPRSVTTPVSSMVLHLWNRKFDINPDLCNIKNLYLTSEALVIETTLLFDIIYDKQEKLPDLLYRLWTTPKGKGEKKWFRGTTVTEI